MTLTKIDFTKPYGMSRRSFEINEVKDDFDPTAALESDVIRLN